MERLLRKAKKGIHMNPFQTEEDIQNMNALQGRA